MEERRLPQPAALPSHGRDGPAQPPRDQPDLRRRHLDIHRVVLPPTTGQGTHVQHRLLLSQHPTHCFC